MNFFPKCRAIGSTNGTKRNRFHADDTSMRQRSRVMGVTVVRLENQYFPARITSVRMFGRIKSMVVVMLSPPAYMRSNLYGAEFFDGWCADMRKPSGIGSKFFRFSWMECPLRHHQA